MALARAWTAGILLMVLLGCASLPGYRSVARPGPTDPWNPVVWSGEQRWTIVGECVSMRYPANEVPK
jgi:hypothetical protein